MDARVNGEPTDADRYPTLTEVGRDILRHMSEHPCAPLFRNRSGNRLLTEEVNALRAYEREIAEAPFQWAPGAPPAWLDAFVAQMHDQVPHYRQLGHPGSSP